jgi:hypothetical protein
MQVNPSSSQGNPSLGFDPNHEGQVGAQGGVQGQPLRTHDVRHLHVVRRDARDR